MIYARQRQDLIDEGLSIPVFNTIDDLRAGIVSEYMTLDQWISGEQDEGTDGVFTTDTGVFYTIDLDYKEEL